MDEIIVEDPIKKELNQFYCQVSSAYIKCCLLNEMGMDSPEDYEEYKKKVEEYEQLAQKFNLDIHRFPEIKNSNNLKKNSEI